MNKTKSLQFKKLSANLPDAPLNTTSKHLVLFKRLINQSTELGEEIGQVITKLRQVAAPEGEPFIFTTLLADNKRLLQSAFQDCDDIAFRSFETMGRQALLVYLSGMTDTVKLEKNVLETLMKPLNSNSPQENVLDNLNTIGSNLITSAAFSVVKQASQAIDAVLSGNALLMIDGITDAFLIGTTKYVKRNIDEATTDAVAQGAHDGFNETLRDGLVLIRRRAHDNNIKVSLLQVGERSRTSIALVYVSTLVKPGLVEEVKRRLQMISTDRILTSQTIQELLGDHPWTPFPQAERTERPDVVASAIYEGRMGILVDNTPMALIVPCTYAAIMQSIDDYTATPLAATLIRLLRHCSALLATFMPAIYIAVVSYHPGMLPTTLAISIAELRARTPFPAFLEVLMMLVVLEIFQEAILRIPNKIVTAASVIGGFVIGTTIVQAGLSNPMLVVVMAMTAIASYGMNYSLGLAFRTLRVVMVILASTLGLYGVVLGALVILTHMCSLRNFGESYLGGIFDINLLEDWKDTLVRLPEKFLRSRPKQFGAQDHQRQGNDYE